MSVPQVGRTRGELPRFSDITNPRRPDIKRAHAVITGEGENGRPFGGRFLCAWCGWASDWLSFDTPAEIRRGIACPDCNADRTGAEREAAAP